MVKYPSTRLPKPMYDYLKEKAIKKETSMRIEANNLFERYKRMSIEFKKLKGKKVYVIR